MLTSRWAGVQDTILRKVWSESGKDTFSHCEWARMCPCLQSPVFLLHLLAEKRKCLQNVRRMQVLTLFSLMKSHTSVDVCSALSILWTTQRSKLQLLSWPCVLLVALLCPSMTQIHIISFYDSYYLWDLGLL